VAPTEMRIAMTLAEKFTKIDARYSEQINSALARGEHDKAEKLAASYDKKMARLYTPLRRLAHA
jgi:hypothetical protein